MNIGILFLIVWVIWIVSEIILARMKHSGTSRSMHDKYSLRILWTTIIVCVCVGNTLGFQGIGLIRTGSKYIALTGLAFIIIGLVVRWTAILTLKKYFTVDVAIAADQQLVTNGLYKIIRHPAYTGSLLSFLGLGLTISSWVSVAIIFIPILSAFLYRIHVEEKALGEYFGEEYVQYASTTKRLVPWIY